MPKETSQMVLILAFLALLTYETTYTDASKAKCAAFSIGAHESDLCYGRLDR